MFNVNPACIAYLMAQPTCKKYDTQKIEFGNAISCFSCRKAIYQKYNAIYHGMLGDFFDNLNITLELLHGEEI